MTDPSPTPLVLLHGFTQNRQCWGPFAGQLDDGRPVERWDLPGHGGGGPAADGWATADRLAAQAAARTAATAAPGATTTAEAARASDWLGYSLGGRMLLHLVLAHPNMVRRAVLIGATAGLATSAERAERRGADEALAECLAATGDTDGAKVAYRRAIELGTQRGDADGTAWAAQATAALDALSPWKNQTVIVSGLHLPIGGSQHSAGYGLLSCSQTQGGADSYGAPTAKTIDQVLGTDTAKGTRGRMR